MGSLKRKEAPGGDNPPKKAKPSKDTRPSKRDATKEDAATRNGVDTKKRKTDTVAVTTAPKTVVSLLKDEEPLFPRGGASVLTPLEHKQIQMQAKADALAEDEFDTTEHTKAKTKKLRRRESKAFDLDDSKKGKSKGFADEDAVRVESLNFKRLVKGSLVLGQITSIGLHNLTVSLPNNLTGNVSIAAISDVITARLQKDAEESDEDSNEEDDGGGDDDEDNGVDLKSLFEIGQYVRAYVVSTKDEENTGKSKAKPRRNIELSLRPSETNSGLSKDDVVPHVTVMAAITSVQDHGYEMDLGIDGKKLKGFLSKKEVGANADEIMNLQPGAVFLCLVKTVSGKVAQLTMDPAKLGSVEAIANTATTVNSFQPGSAVDVLVTAVSGRGLSGKILGHLTVTADLVHSGAGPDGVDLEAKHRVGSRVNARVICTFPAARDPKLGISLLPHITKLRPKTADERAARPKSPLDLLPIASIVEECTVRSVEPDIGLYVDLGVPGLSGFVHISKVRDGKVDALYETSGAHKVGSVHQGRIIGYSPLDGMFVLSFEKSILEQRFIRLEDVPVGEVVSCTIERVVVGANGVSGLILKLADGITGYVHETHLADVRLQHPERKFREGMTVKARVLSVRPRKRQMRLTLKKTLVNSDAPIIQSFDEVAVGTQALGTICDIKPHGARIEFYRGVRGFLPVSEMSEAYIQDPTEHFRVGQVVNVHVLEVNPEARKLVVSCKDPSAFGLEKQAALKALTVGDMVSGKVMQKTEDEIFIELDKSELKAILRVGHLTDKSASKNQSAFKRLHVGQELSDLMVLDKNERRRAIVLTMKPSLIDASKNGKLLRGYADAKVKDVVPGFVSNIRPGAVLVQFGGNLVGVLFKTRLPKEDQEKENFGLRKHQSLTVKVVAVDLEKNRLVVAPASSEDGSAEEKEKAKDNKQTTRPQIHGPVQDIALGQILDARIVGIHATQLNVETEDKVQGRVDVSQIFDSWDDIQDPSNPLSQFNKGDTIRVRAMGLHDSKNHRFLAFSHRSYNSVVEFTAKPSDLAADELKPLSSLAQLERGASYVAFVNNASRQCLWVNISPVVRGRVSAMDASDDVSQASDLVSHFPVGSAVRVRVVDVDPAKQRLDLSARTSPAVSWDSLKPNMVLAGVVSQISERQVMVKLSPTVSGSVHLVDVKDDFSEANTLHFNKGEPIRVSVVEVDKANKRIRLSTRPSRVLNSSSPMADREITDAKQIAPGDIIRGFVKHVGDKGVFVLLGGKVTAMVKIGNLSDRFLKEWKDQFQVDQLVKGRVLAVDAAGSGHVELSLKSSVVDEDYTPLVTYRDLKPGQFVTGKVRKVEDFGAFIVVDDSANVSGLCHRSEMADKPVEDARKLYQEGDLVKAKVLDVNAAKKRVSFGLKPAYFDEEEEDTDMEDGEGAVLVSSGEEDGDEDVDSDEGIDLMNGGAPIKFIGLDNDDSEEDDEDEDEDGSVDEEDEDEDEDEDEGAEDAVDDDGDVSMSGQAQKKKEKIGLGAGKYDWTGHAFDDSDDAADAAAPTTRKQQTSKQKQRKEEDGIQIDRTAQLDVNGPQTASDFERLLLGQPDSSSLWIAYMALQMQVSELSKAREIAERAIRTINIREVTEKLNVWIAYLNLEVAYGTKKTVDEVFQRACQYNDDREVHERLATIYIQSNKRKAADALFQTMLSRYGSQSVDVWTNYAHFLHVTLGEADRARALLPRATQALGERHTAGLMAKFGALEFRSPHGDAERGRTTFETLLATWPKRFDYWNQLADLEVSAAEPDAAAVRDVFERGARVRGLKPQRAMKWFKRWAEWEGKTDPKGPGRERVMAKAQEWVAAAKARKEAAAAKGEGEGGEEIYETVEVVRVRFRGR
ncbi:rRNA biogenesis protein RRP5 [Sodiomyces alkalinus F11]|uniref:rRNA biogenesis protein RRP5 n=1 Tax=Sodiomyces alkalinus (strain CBS 110278 / VKM F-3762 / F11) TaxID=1314773 RepID=A0A3N2PVS2_SODAK|nr:rRNA biogenesis protein RRP5 [Sodiomyces alkalinus F11]ROT38446.1 rRNA biogenesis protein RRP5 [Sodiomyces alkalinus F11]